MNVPDIIIAVDGFSATGKSSFAKLAAAEMSFIYLDSGALYRAVTLFALENSLIAKDGTIDEAGLAASLPGLDIHFERTDNGSETHIGPRSVEKAIRGMEVSSHVSPVSAIPFVRQFVDGILHEAGKAGRVIMDGRDIGTTVFPDAQVKIFMTADVEIRTQRRYDELKAKGENPDYEEVKKNLLERDYIDSHRETSPLSRAADSYEMNNSDMTLHEEIVWLRGLLQGKFGILDA